MAIRGESAREMVDGQVSDFTRLEFQVLPDVDERVQSLPPADPENPTVREKIFVRRGIPVHREDGGPSEIRWTPWVHINDSGIIAGDAAALFPALKRIHDAGKASLGL